MAEYMIYGFTMPESTLVNWGYRVALAQRRRPSAIPSENVRTAMEDIVKRMGGLRVRLVLAYYLSECNGSTERDYAIALASNAMNDGLPNTPPSDEAAEKLRAVLGIKPDTAPAWYYADRTAEDIPRRI